MKIKISIERKTKIPDKIKIARSLRIPELGPKILFFSGGSALRPICRSLKLYTHNSIHLITPFDSGGSSAEIRKAFNMLSIGDLRNRLMALADETVKGNPEVYRLFSSRLPNNESQDQLLLRLKKLILQEDPLISEVPHPLRQIIQTHLRIFLDKMPKGFDLRGASIGNLILTAGYLDNERDIDSVIFLFSKLVEVRGSVHPVVDTDMQLLAKLKNGKIICGQHKITGKEEAPIEDKISSLSLVKSYENPTISDISITEKTSKLIRKSDLICYPIGSFYSSLLANLLPSGVGREIIKAEVPKVYVPNFGIDPEMKGMSLSESVKKIIEIVRRDSDPNTAAKNIMNFILVDSKCGSYGMDLDYEDDFFKESGITILDLDLVSKQNPNLIDPKKISDILISMC